MPRGGTVDKVPEMVVGVMVLGVEEGGEGEGGQMTAMTIMTIGPPVTEVVGVGALGHKLLRRHPDTVGHLNRILPQTMAKV